MPETYYVYVVFGFQNINRVFDLRRQSMTEHRTVGEQDLINYVFLRASCD